MIRRAFSLVEGLVVLAIVGLLIALLLPAVQQLRAVSQRTACLNHLRNQALAVHSYDAALGRLPPAMIYGPYLPHGVPENVAHGMWPTLVGFLGESKMSAAYQFSVSYDHDDNQPVATIGLGVLRCPGSDGSAIQMWDDPPPDGTGKYGAVGDYGAVAVSSILKDMGWVEPDAHCEGVLSVNSRTRMADVKDGRSTTIMLVEAPGRAGSWASPSSFLGVRDFAHGDPPGPFGGGGAEFSTPHPAGGNVAFADGSARFLKNGMSARVLGALLTRNGGEVVDANDF